MTIAEILAIAHTAALLFHIIRKGFISETLFELTLLDKEER